MIRLSIRMSVVLAFLCVSGLLALAKSGGIDPDVPVVWLNLDLPSEAAYDFAIDPVSPAHICVATSDVAHPVIYTNDFGETWITTTEGLPEMSNARSVAIDPVSPNYVYAGLTLGHGVYRSADGGETWHPKSNGIAGAFTIVELGVHPVTPTLVFAGAASASYLYRSDNRGETWASIPLSGPVARILVDPHDPAKIYAVAEGDILISTDAGVTWDSSGIEGSAIAVHPSNASIIYLLADCYVYRSIDGGMTWVSMLWTPIPCYQDLHMDPADGNVLYLTGQDRQVARSVNGGRHWMVLDKRFGGGPAPTSSAFAIDPVDTTRIYVYGRGEGYSGMFAGLYLDQSVHLPVVSR